MQRQHQRHGDPIDQVADHRPVLAAENAIFMLNPQHLGAAVVDAAGGQQVIVDIVLADDLRHTFISQRYRAGVVQRIDIDRDVGLVERELVDDVTGKCRDPALARGIGANQRDPRRRGPWRLNSRRQQTRLPVRGKERDNVGCSGRFASSERAELFAAHEQGSSLSDRVSPA